MTERATEFLITLAQLNPTVGDVEGNAAKARAARERAKADGADLVVLSELFIAGYQPEDLVLKPAFQAACRSAIEALARETADGGPAMLIGVPWVEEGKLYNACALLDGGRIAALRFKANLPNYGVFDEKRLFARGPTAGPVVIRGVRVGVPICEDVWVEESEDYENVVECQAETGAEIIIVPNGSPYARDKVDIRLSVAVARVTESGLPLIYLNQVGGQDEVVYDGASFALNGDLSVAAQLPAFVESITTLRWTKDEGGSWRCSGPIASELDADKADYAACVLGLRDYVRKNGFPGVLLGISGGIDSALCAAIAVDALGKEQVRGVMLPFRYTAQVSLEDAAKLAKNLDIRYEVLPIADAVNGFEKILSVPFAGLERDITEENLQARTRGTLLMAISNKTGAMVVTTGNKSEMSVGYATLYGDMNGGFNPIKDIYKTEVFRLSSLRNIWKPDGALGPSGEVIPPNIITRPPTAELRENQTDQDSLPPYDVLDAILERLVEREEPLASIVAAGFDRDVVARVDRLLNIAEYKRRQAAPGVKVTSRNFGRDRRYPITNRFRDMGKPLPEPDETLFSHGTRASVEAFDG